MLPSVAKQLPTEQQLRSWTWASQQAFWEQRRQHWLGKGGSGWWGSWKLGDLQRECRKRDIWPGGDRPFVVDRLLRADFCRSRLLSCETITEEQAMHEQSQIGYLYYRVVSEPIDLRSIRAKLAARQYATVKALESDLLLLCVNTKKFDSAHGQSNGQTARHANEIQRVVRAAVRSLLAGACLCTGVEAVHLWFRSSPLLMADRRKESTAKPLGDAGQAVQGDGKAIDFGREGSREGSQLKHQKVTQGSKFFSMEHIHGGLRATHG